MIVPEAPVYEYDFVAAPENDVRLARQGLVVKPIPISEREENAANNELGCSVLRADAGHVPSPLLWIQPVSHETTLVVHLGDGSAWQGKRQKGEARPRMRDGRVVARVLDLIGRRQSEMHKSQELCPGGIELTVVMARSSGRAVLASVHWRAQENVQPSSISRSRILAARFAAFRKDAIRGARIP